MIMNRVEEVTGEVDTKNDAALQHEPESFEALGFGFRKFPHKGSTWKSPRVTWNANIIWI